MKILLVDDDEGTLITMRIALSHRKHQVVTTANPGQALSLLQENRFDWLLTDGEMSTIDGFRLADEAHRLRPQLKIAMISGIYEKRDIGHHPILKLFPKPVDIDELSDYLNEPYPAPVAQSVR